MRCSFIKNKQRENPPLPFQTEKKQWGKRNQHDERTNLRNLIFERFMKSQPKQTNKWFYCKSSPVILRIYWTICQNSLQNLRNLVLYYSDLNFKNSILLKKRRNERRKKKEDKRRKMIIDNLTIFIIINF